MKNYLNKNKKKFISFLILNIFILSFISVGLRVEAATSGPNSPSTGADDSSIGTITWSNPTRIVSSNDSYATASLDDNQISHYLKATNFSFAIPSGAVINGITVEIEKKSSNASRIEDYRVRIIKGGVIGATDRANVNWWGTSDAYIAYGSSSDLWGESWTYNDINNANFGVAISAYKNTTAGGSVTASIDHIRITITYTVNTAPNVPVLVSPASGSTTNDNTPTLSANYSDPDAGDTGTTSYRIATSAPNCLAGTVVTSGVSTETSSNNQNTTWTPGSSIGSSATYYWCAQNNDGVAQSAWTSMGNFILDTIAPTITINNPTTAPAQSKTITASTDEGTLTMSNTTGSTCDGTLIFVAYASQTFTSESDNGKKVCYKAIDAATNTTYTMSNAIAGIDATSPTVSTVAVQTALTVNITFSEAMGIGVTTAANYTLSGTGKGTLANNPNNVALVSGNTYVLTWASGSMVNGGNITITVANAQDIVGNAMGTPNSGTHTGGGISLIAKFVIIDPTDGTVDNPIAVTVQAQRADNSIDTTYQSNVTLIASGSATGDGLVDIVNGIGTLNISDTLAETVNLSLSDTQGTGLDVSSTQSVVFEIGMLAKFVINNPGDFYAKTRVGYTVTRKDQFNNLITSGTDTVYLYSSSTSSSKKFYNASSGGNIISFIDIIPGHSSASFWYYDESPGTYTITVSDSTPAPDGATGIDDSEDSVVAIPVAVKFVIIDPTDGTVDNPIAVTVQAQKPDNSVDTNYQEDVTLVASGSATGGGLINIVNGVGTRNISDIVAETVNLSLSDTQSTGLDFSSTQQVVFAGGAISQFALDDPGTLSAGSRIGYIVTRKDQYNNLTASGVNRVYLYSSSSGANKKFYSAATSGSVITSIDIIDVNSTANFWYYDEVPGIYTITASDNSSFPDGNININDAVDSITVVAGPISQFSLNDPGDVNAGTRLGYTATRKDEFGNSVSSGNTTIYLYSSSGSGIFYNAATSGSVITSVDITNTNSTANFWYYDESPGAYTITVSDGTISAMDGVTISAIPIVATRFVIIDPTDGTVDNPIAVTVQAQDDSGNIDTTYQSDVTLNTTGSATGGGLVNIVDGIGSLNISDTLAETVDLFLTDSQITGLNVTSTQNVVFSVGNVNQFSLNNPGDMSAGTRIGYTVTRKDAYGNLVSSGLTKVYLYGLPAEITKKFYDAPNAGSVITFINITDGNSSANFWYYDEHAEISTIVVSDNATYPDGAAGIGDADDQVIVSAGAVAKFLLNNPGDMNINTRLGYIVSRKDQFDNPVTSGVTIVYLYTSSTGPAARFYDSAIGGLFVNSVAIDDANQSANFWYYDEEPGTWVITVSDSTPVPNGNAGVADDADSVTVSTIPIVATRFVILDPGNADVGTPLDVIIQAQNDSGNIDATYQSDVTLNTTGSATGGGLVNIVNGVATIQIRDNVDETVILTLSDTQGTGLNVSSSRRIIFSSSSVPRFGGGGAGVPVPIVGKVSFSGRAYPGAELSILAIKENGEQIIKKDSISSVAGSFAIEFSGLSAGSRAYALSVQDKDDRAAQIKIFDLNLLDESSILEISDIVVSPTIGFSRPTITKGDFLAIIGYATPGSKVNIEIDGKQINGGVIVKSSGEYNYLYNTANLDFGSHTIRASQNINSSLKSDFSPQKVFFITNLTVPETDFNNDGKMNISDWSIFLSRWFSKDEKVKMLDDLNEDKKVDASDFSIFVRTLRK